MEEYNRAGFNSAGRYTQQLSLIRSELSWAVVNNDTEYRYRCLKAFFLALTGRMRDKKIKAKDGETSEKVIGEMETYHNDMWAKVKKSFEDLKNQSQKLKGKPIKSDIINLMDEWEIRLRKDENQLGLLMFEAEDPYNAM